MIERRIKTLINRSHWLLDAGRGDEVMLDPLQPRLRRPSSF